MLSSTVVTIYTILYNTKKLGLFICYTQSTRHHILGEDGNPRGELISLQFNWFPSLEPCKPPYISPFIRTFTSRVARQWLPSTGFLQLEDHEGTSPSPPQSQWWRKLNSDKEWSRNVCCLSSQTVISRVSVSSCLSVPLVLSRVTRESTGAFRFTGLGEENKMSLQTAWIWCRN
jgi:hypothetical protein